MDAVLHFGKAEYHKMRSGLVSILELYSNWPKTCSNCARTVSHVKHNNTLLAAVPGFVVTRELVSENLAHNEDVLLTVGLTLSNEVLPS